MSPEQMQALQYLASLPLQAILLIAVVQLWKAYRESQAGRIDDMRQNYEKGLAELRTRVILLEDRAGIRYETAPNSSLKANSSVFGSKDPKLD